MSAPTASTVPLPAAFFHPTLQVLAKHLSGVRRRDIHEPVADLLELTRRNVQNTYLAAYSAEDDR